MNVVVPAADEAVAKAEDGMEEEEDEPDRDP